MNSIKIVKQYLFITFGVTFTFWISAIFVSQKNPDSSLVLILHILGGLGPLVAVIVYLIKEKKRTEYFSRLINIKNITFLQWLIIFSPALLIISISLAVNGKILVNPEFINAGVFYIFLLLFFGPLPEELGWRGILFDNLTKKSFKKAQFYTATIWFIWHLPLFFIIGTYQNSQGFLTTDFVFWSIQLIVQSFIMGYLYFMTNRSILSAVLFHYFVNLFGELITKSMLQNLLLIGGYILILIALYIVNRNPLNKVEE